MALGLPLQNGLRKRGDTSTSASRWPWQQPSTTQKAEEEDKKVKESLERARLILERGTRKSSNFLSSWHADPGCLRQGCWFSLRVNVMHVRRLRHARFPAFLGSSGGDSRLRVGDSRILGTITLVVSRVRRCVGLRVTEVKFTVHWQLVSAALRHVALAYSFPSLSE